MPGSETAVEIRGCTQDDFDVWLPLWRGYQTFYRVSIPAEVSRVTWSRLLSAEEPIWGAIAWRGQAAIGLVHWIFHRSTWNTGDYCYLQDLFVDGQARGLGVGRRLIEWVYAEADRAEASRVYWLTHETNTPAMALYDQVAEKSGFVQFRKQLSPR